MSASLSGTSRAHADHRGDFEVRQCANRMLPARSYGPCYEYNGIATRIRMLLGLLALLLVIAWTLGGLLALLLERKLPSCVSAICF